MNGRLSKMKVPVRSSPRLLMLQVTVAVPLWISCFLCCCGGTGESVRLENKMLERHQTDVVTPVLVHFQPSSTGEKPPRPGASVGPQKGIRPDAKTIQGHAAATSSSKVSAHENYSASAPAARPGSDPSSSFQSAARWARGSPSPPGERLRVRLSPFGRSMVLMLRRDARFLAKGFSIEARDPASVEGSPPGSHRTPRSSDGAGDAAGAPAPTDAGEEGRGAPAKNAHGDGDLKGPSRDGGSVAKNNSGVGDVQNTLTEEEKLCFYSGFVHGQRNSAVTLNMCNGLLGFIRFGEEQLFIEPLAGAAAPASLGLPHLVSRRSGLHVKSSHDPQPATPEARAGSGRARRSMKLQSWPRRLSSSKYCKIIPSEKVERGARQEEGPRGRRNAIRPPAREYAVETLVVAARDVVEEHGTEGSTKLLLTVMSMVYNIFQHSSLAIPIHVRLARLVLLHEHPESLYVGHHGERTLQSFCRWQNSEMGHGASSQAPPLDAAIFVTRTDFCVHTDEPCDTVGIAFLGGMCSDLRKCVIAEENGLGLAFTIAHELGHNMGMGHDDDDGGGGGGNSACGLGPSIMAGEWVRGSNSSELSWSPCSRLELQQFLRSPASACMTETEQQPGQTDVTHVRPQSIQSCAAGKCLNQSEGENKPKEPPRSPPTEEATRGQPGPAEEKSQTPPQPPAARDQAKAEQPADNGLLQTGARGSGADVAGGVVEPPRDARGECGGQRSVEPWAEPRDGAWGPWGGWSACNQPCGPGLRYRQRRCDLPPPRPGGAECRGGDVQHGVCQLISCAEETPASRDRQCQVLHWGGPPAPRPRRWSSVTDPERPCALLCTAGRKEGATLAAESVQDGTPCGPYERDVCLGRRCQKVGCDGIVGSPVREDRCGMCDGDGKSCKVVKGDFNHTRGTASSHCKKVSICSLSKAKLPTKCYFCYVKALTIPAGARRIRVVEHKPAHSYLAVNDSSQNSINSEWKVERPGDYSVAGSTVRYVRRGIWEKMTVKGPLKQPLNVMVLLFHDHNVGIHYEFTVPVNRSARHGERPRTPLYMWTHVGWENCSVQCGGGEVRSILGCTKIVNRSQSCVPDEDCRNVSRPPLQNRHCNSHPCPNRWKVSEWSPCSRTCGKGLQTRSVSCHLHLPGGGSVRTRDGRCPKPRPPSSQGCQGHDCLGVWQATSWSQCSSRCGKGTRVRTAQCTSPHGRCLATSRPREQDGCEDYSQCYEWKTGDWSKCSTSCGRGLQSRVVHCMHRVSGRHGSGCEADGKPVTYRECGVGECDRTFDANTITSPRLVALTYKCLGDQWSVYCRLVRERQLCRDLRWYQRCCETCRDFYAAALLASAPPGQPLLFPAARPSGS
uniref:A disintegrin and metalloproteinase with thrombospondin motifs 17 isoform X2 n=1 Tax=Petromyzon marinus TaxID=7757 RepID=A0AAJ7SSG0_PETMA|nr:A disintegrin and metalloproteinase with thrombospondin motifs 17 isoform X2 [Petromyzon marinus]